jgi:[acyl-carrier-protein] S-malonyltransferase
METLTSAGVDTLIEVGPGNVLSGLAKRAMAGVTTAQLSSSADLGL